MEPRINYGSLMSKQITVSADQRPPAHPFYGDSWERGLDPFHPNAFQGFSEDIVSQIRAMSPGAQRGGWFLLDAWKNEIGFVPDGAVFEIATVAQ
jgi:hypothetical protein